jgi:drug/metabolite transporter (DMT)-like permease
MVKEDRVFKLTMWITSLIASMMPVISIAILIKMKELNSRLGVIAAFNALLSVCLIMFTDAKRTDVFSVTAA